MRSIDENTFNSGLEDLEQRYVPDHVREVSYVKETWLDLYKEKLVKSWVDRHSHFGSVVTSRVEGIHALFGSSEYWYSRCYAAIDVYRRAPCV